MDRLNVSLRTSGPPEVLSGDALLSAAAVAAANDPSPHERVARIVRTIEADIIPRLMRLHREPSSEPRLVAPVEAGAPTQEELRRFVRLVLLDNDGPWNDAVRRLRERGVSTEGLYLQLLAPAARELGRMWEDDECLFSDVTVAVGRLQRVMRSLSPDFARDLDVPHDGRRILLAVAPGEQHTFGLAMVAEFFRRGGWDVIGGYHDPSFDPVACLQREWVDVLGVTCSAEGRFEPLKSWVAEMRRSSCNQALGVLVGGAAFAHDAERFRDVGADGTAVDGLQALAAAERLLDTRVLRL